MNASTGSAAIAAAPVAATVVATLTIDEEWTYLVDVETWQATTNFDAKAANMGLYNDGVLVSALLVADRVSHRQFRLYVRAGKKLEVKAIADAGANTVYAASITATRAARHVAGV